jgi:SAM-dependent methyltransferase
VTRAEADFIALALDLAPGARLLDVPCGDGRHLLALAEREVTGTGVDLGREQIAVARRAAGERSLPLVFLERDMRDIEWEEAFDAAICFGNSFGYFAEEENRAFLAAIHRALVPGGRFLLDTRHVAEPGPPPFAPRTTYRTGDVLVLIEQTLDPLTRRVDAVTTFIRGGAVEKRHCSYRLTTYAELCAQLSGLGFFACRGFAALDGQPFTPVSDRLLLLATKA